MFSELPLHPIVVHLPLVLALLIPFMALALGHMIHNKKWPLQAWVIVIVLQICLVGSGFAAMKTGELDEDKVEEVIGKNLVHEHEEAAEIFVYTGLAVLILSLVPILLKSKIPFKLSVSVTILATFVVLGLAINTGYLGGEMVYKHLLKSR